MKRGEANFKGVCLALAMGLLGWACAHAPKEAPTVEERFSYVRTYE